MPESEAHKRYMQRYRAKKIAEGKAQDAAATLPSDTHIPWRTRRHKVRKSDGNLTTEHLFERRAQLGIMADARALVPEEVDRKLEIEAELRTRGEVGQLAGPERYDWASFYTEMYNRLGLGKYLPRVLDELTS
jgi:hypothetical protein